MVSLTVGIIHEGKRKGLARTLAALRRQPLQDAEIIVVDTTVSKATRKLVKAQPGLRYLASDAESSGAALDRLFRAAHGEVVLCLEGQVRLQAGALDALRAYFSAHPASPDLIHGPLMEGQRLVATHSAPQWRHTIWGRRARDPRGRKRDGPAFVIPMQEPGVFSCRRDAWPGMPAGWRGHGGAAGYLQERFRQRGAVARCLPGLRWELAGSRTRPAPPHSPGAYRACHNHLAGAADVGLDTRFIALRYRDRLPRGVADAMRVKALRLHEAQAPSPPLLVSCLLYAGRLTSKRAAVLEEAIEAFLRQDYPAKELILFNDIPQQTVICEAPGVRVVNTSAHCPSLGDAYNAAAAFAQGDLFAPWSGASISLPWRLPLSLEALGSSPVFRPEQCWYMLDGELDPRPAQPDGGEVALFTREAFRAVGGYASRTLGVHREMDAALDAQLAATGQPSSQPVLAPAEWFTIIRRQQHDAQYEGNPFIDPWLAQAELPVKPGPHVLHPRWAQDYVALCQHGAAPDKQEPELAPALTFVLGRNPRGKTPHFPRLDQRADETAAEHLARTDALVRAATAAGALRLAIPPAEADWLGRHPHLAEYFAVEHWLVETGGPHGTVFALHRDERAGARRDVRHG